MARSVLRAGLPLVVHDLRAEATRPFQDMGARVADNLAALARAADIVAVCVLNDAQATAVVSADHGLLAAMTPGQVLVLHSTVSPQTAIDMERLASQHGVLFLDAPVSGASMRSREDGTLTVFAGGSETAFDAALPMLRAVGSTVERVGPAGSGQVCKLCNNLMLFCNTLGSLEAARLAAAYGISEDRMVRMALASSGASWSLKEWGYLDKMRHEHSLAHDEDALLDFLAKDLHLACDAAKERDVELPMGSHACKIVRSALKDRWDLVAQRSGE